MSPPARETREPVINLSVEGLKELGILFRKNQSSIPAVERAKLDELVEELADFDGYVFVLAGSDRNERPGRKAKLAAARAAAVAAYLKAEAPAIASRIRNLAGVARTVPKKGTEGEASDRVVTVTLADRAAVSRLLAALDAPADRSESESSACMAATKNSRTDCETASQRDTPDRGKAPSLWAARARYIYAPTSPATYDNLIYKGLGDDAKFSYNSRPAQPSSAFCTSIEMEGPLGPVGRTAIAVRYRRYRDFEATSILTSASGTVRDKVKATAYGGVVDILPLKSATRRGFTLVAGLGAEADWSKVDLEEDLPQTSVAIDSSPKTQVSSTLLVGSVRMRGGVRYRFFGVELSLDAAVQVPVFEAAQNTKANRDGEYWERALDHRSALGSEIGFGMGATF